MTTPSLRPLSIGEILDGSFALYRRHFLVFYSTALALMAPSIVIQAVGPDSRAEPLASLAVVLVASLFYTLASVAAIEQMSRAALGGVPDFRGGVKISFRRFIPALLAGTIAAIQIFIGLFLLIVPGVILAIDYFAVVPVVTLELDAAPLMRSRALAKNSRGKIFMVMVIATIIAFLPATAVGAGTGLYSQSVQPGSRRLVGLILQTLVAALTYPFSQGVMTLLYYDQRVRKEGLDVKLAAAAFDDLAPAPGSPGAPQAQP